MDSKVVGLDGKAVEAAPDYNTDVVSLLETALADAKKYKSSGVAIALINPTDEGKSYDVDVYWHGKRLTVLSATARLNHRINLKCDEAMEVMT